MDKTRKRMTSPPRSTRAGPGTGICVPDIVTRTFDLVTSKEVIPFYVLAAGFSFHYAQNCRAYASPRPVDFVIFSMLPLVYLVELVRHPPDNVCPVHDQARRYIRLGLFVSTIGNGLRAWYPDIYLMCWIASTCIAFCLYSIAYYQYYRPGNWGFRVILLSVVLLAVLIYLIQEPLTSIYVVIYGMFLTVLGFFAISRLETCRSGPAYLGWAGVMLFVLSGYLYALTQLVPSLSWCMSDTVTEMTHYLAQLGIALSTYTIKICPTEEPPTSGQSSTPGRSDSSASVNMSRIGSKASK